MLSSQMCLEEPRAHLCPVAQTNLQLWQQLQVAGYDSDELTLVGKTYRVAFTLFSGRFRASGKSFIAHLIGTASVLVHLKAPTPVIAAGLIHAAYDFGDFGGWRRLGLTPAKQRWLVGAVGTEVESYVASYSALIWNPKTIPSVRERMVKFREEERWVLLIRLANELEEYLDLGLLYCGSKSQIYSGHQTNLVADMARVLGYPTLAEALTEAQQAMMQAQVLPVLVNPTGIPNSSLVVPKSCQRKMLPWLSQSLLGRIIQRLVNRTSTGVASSPVPVISKGHAS